MRSRTVSLTDACFGGIIKDALFSMQLWHVYVMELLKSCKAFLFVCLFLAEKNVWCDVALNVLMGLRNELRPLLVIIPCRPQMISKNATLEWTQVYITFDNINSEKEKWNFSRVNQIIWYLQEFILHLVSGGCLKE